MNSTSAFRLALPLGLLLLVLCSSGLALQCYKCGMSPGPCTTTGTCSGNQDACIRITSQGSNQYACNAYTRCNVNHVAADYPVGSSVEIACCQKDLCNNGFTGVPASGLILFLAAALLVFFS
ncbi:CD59 glycoprotein [Rana temporaria]|uniref:CD59 glycoprotein n=1 Tax=Rana temporaria TaxID=8407 RepID=UPI001AADBD4F|nr:CD59 glycoprotein [Rana temporaria]